LTATCGCDSNKEETPQVRVSARHLAAACAEGAYLVPMVEVDGARVAAAGDGLSGGEESVADRGERARAGGGDGFPPRRCGGPTRPRRRPRRRTRAPASLAAAAATPCAAERG
jgi:hypothetical protein